MKDYADRVIATRNAMAAVTGRTPTAENYTTSRWDELAATSAVYLAAEKVWLKKVRGRKQVCLPPC